MTKLDKKKVKDKLETSMGPSPLSSADLLLYFSFAFIFYFPYNILFIIIIINIFFLEY